MPDVEEGQQPGDYELREGEYVGDVDVADDVGPHELRGESVAERQQEVVDEEENRRGKHEANSGADQLFELVSLLQAFPVGHLLTGRTVPGHRHVFPRLWRDRRS